MENENERKIPTLIYLRRYVHTNIIMLQSTLIIWI